MVTIREIKDIPCELYDPSGKIVGIVENELQFHDVRFQIKKQKLEGYYFLFNRPDGVCERVDINNHGRCDASPNGFFDSSMNLLMELL
jgi:hypothetical protein